MKKITEFFYIFSKLTASIVFFVIILILGYLLYNSYNNVDKVNQNFQKQINILSDSNKANDNQISSIEKILENNDLILARIEKSLKDLYFEIEGSGNKLEGEKIINNIKNIEIQISEIKKSLKTENLVSSLESKGKNFNLQSDLVSLMLIKFKSGINIKDEIIYLEKILPTNQKYILEKLSLLELNPFLGIDNLKNEFETAINSYAKHNYLLENQNSIINFIMKFVDIKLNNINKYQDGELSILVNAKKLMELEKIKESLELILEVKNNDLFFVNWINQAEIYLSFMIIIKEVL